jgi:DHA1 family multidrug resistance protein-like MFS transporter
MPAFRPAFLDPARYLPAESWRRNQYAVFISVFVSWLGFSFVQPFLPLYIHQLGVTDVGEIALLSGIALGISPLMSGLLAPVWGILADRIGIKIMVQRSLLSFVVLNFVASLVVSPWQLLAVRFGIGLLGGFGPITTSLVTLGAPQKEVAPAIGRLQAIQILATAVGPTLGGLVADTFGIRTSFVVTAVLCGIAFLLMTVLYREDRERLAKRKSTDVLPIRDLLALSGFIPLAFILFITQYVDRGFGPIVPLFIADIDPTLPVASTAGLVFSAGLFVSAISASQIGGMVNRREVRQILPICAGIGVIGTLPLIFFGKLWLMVLVQVIMGFSAGTIVTLSYAAIAQIVPDTSRSTSFGFMGSAVSLASALGPIGSGALAAFTLHTVYIVDAVLYAGSLGLSLSLWRRLRAPSGPAITVIPDVD